MSALPPPNAKTHQPPHLTTPVLQYLQAEEFDSFFEAVLRGFHEEQPLDDERRALERALVDDDRMLGFKVGDRWIATCGSFARDVVLPGGRSIPVAAVTAVTVQSSYRRRGLLRQMMQTQLEEVRDRGEALAVLWASESSIYGRFGYGMSTPRLRMSAQTRSMGFMAGLELGNGSVDEVDREVFQPVATNLYSKLRKLRVGGLSRQKSWWDYLLLDPQVARDGANALRHVLHYDDSGTPTGYALYRVKEDGNAQGPNNEVRIVEVDGLNAAASGRLWRYLFDLDLARSFRKTNCPVDDPVQFMLADPRAVMMELSDGVYTRIVDIPQALTARAYGSEVDVVIGIEDEQLPENSRNWQLTAGPSGATCRPARRKPDLSMGIRELGAVFMGGPTLAGFAAAGRVVEHKSGAVARVSRAFAGDRQPHCPEFF